ncbi:MAG: hypothetical protein EHJ95_04510, partial [Methanobacteriota archaeon]
MLFGSSGIRRTFDLDFVGLSVRVGTAVAGRARRVVLGRDTRTTSPILADAVTAGLLSAGAEVRTAGIVPTPAVAYAARGADAGCMITASHNPEPDNGIKLFSPSGASFTGDTGRGGDGDSCGAAALRMERSGPGRSGRRTLALQTGDPRCGLDRRGDSRRRRLRQRCRQRRHPPPPRRCGGRSLVHQLQ